MHVRWEGERTELVVGSPSWLAASSTAVAVRELAEASTAAGVELSVAAELVLVSAVVARKHSYRETGASSVDCSVVASLAAVPACEPPVVAAVDAAAVVVVAAVVNIPVVVPAQTCA